MPQVTITVAAPDPAQSDAAIALLVPKALTTDHQTFKGLEIEGQAKPNALIELQTGQHALALTGCLGPIALHYQFEKPGLATRPDNYVALDNRYTRASLDLSDSIVPLINDDSRYTAQSIIDHTANLFEYGHPDEKFNDGHDEVPVIACGTAKGSCIDINTYVISAMRVAGIPVVYFAGYFFPEEKGGCTQDMHCWVATWHDDHWLEWDIAHHLKMGLGAGEIRPGYNPKPGRRYAITYGRGLAFQIGNVETVVSHLSEPMWVYRDGHAEKAVIEARLGDLAIKAPSRAR